MKKLTFIAALSALLLLRPASAQQWSMGYWNTTGSPVCPVSDIDWGALTHLIHWAALVHADGTLDLTKENVSTDAASVVAAGHAAGRKVLLGIMQQGWVSGHTNDLQSAITNNRSGLVSNIMAVVQKYGYDGVDIDWEPFDINANGSAMSTFAQALRAQLGSAILTTTASLGQQSYWGTAHTPFDRVNVMTYDWSALWEPYSWHNAALYDHSDGAVSVNLSVLDFTSSGVPPAKLGIGIPFYGWQWTGGGITGPMQRWSSTPSLVQVYYGNLASKITSQNYNWDSFAQVPYLSINTGVASTDQFVTYDNEQSVAAKVNYATSKGLGGWIIWTVGGDYLPTQTPMHPLLTAIKNAMASAPAPAPTSFTISGQVTKSQATALAGVVVTASNGQTVTTNSQGAYTLTVASGFSGTVTPSASGYTFSPQSASFSNLTGNATANFAATASAPAPAANVTISGQVVRGQTPLAGVLITASTGQTATTNSQGAYSLTVASGFTGTVTPTASGYTFSPQSMSFTNLTANATASFSARRRWARLLSATRTAGLAFN